MSRAFAASSGGGIEGRSYLETELIEIDENLCRAELTPSQRAMAIKRRKQVWEALHPEGGNTVSTLGGVQQLGFAADTCAAAGLTKQSVNQHLSRAEALGECFHLRCFIAEEYAPHALC